MRWQAKLQFFLKFLLCPVFLASFVEKNSFSALNDLDILLKIIVSGFLLFYMYSFMQASYSFVVLLLLLKSGKTKPKTVFSDVFGD